MSDEAELLDWYLALSDTNKQIALALASHQLTIHGRAFGLDLTGEDQSSAFTGLNELQHHLSSQIAALGMRRPRYPDEVLWNILKEKAQYYGLFAQLTQSFRWARVANGYFPS